VKCAKRQVDTLPKAAKPACKEAAKNPSVCDQGFKDDADDQKDLIKEEADSAYDECDAGTEFFWNFCRSGSQP